MEKLKIAERKKIVIAEDDSTFAMLLKFRLDEEGFMTFIANDGTQALDLIKEVNPDIFISDIMLPQISGLEVLEQIKQNNSFTFPTLIISSAGQETMVMRAFELGANDFLSKPFSINELIIRIKKTLDINK
ncbi:response regulator transcription factor [Flavobacterium sp.]|uniref:response regulator transcription factor n=1 Tax=Flavobacterium sp. TaxID=239 RepID=UPI002634220E|nr:response regulator transcription factor [Flavobacterium sp.]